MNELLQKLCRDVIHCVGWRAENSEPLHPVCVCGRDEIIRVIRGANKKFRKDVCTTDNYTKKETKNLGSTPHITLSLLFSKLCTCFLIVLISHHRQHMQSLWFSLHFLHMNNVHIYDSIEYIKFAMKNASQIS